MSHKRILDYTVLCNERKETPFFFFKFARARLHEGNILEYPIMLMLNNAIHSWQLIDLFIPPVVERFPKARKEFNINYRLLYIGARASIFL